MIAFALLISISSCGNQISHVDVSDNMSSASSQKIKAIYLGAKVEFEFFESDVKVLIHRNDGIVQIIIFEEVDAYVISMLSNKKMEEDRPYYIYRNNGLWVLTMDNWNQYVKGGAIKWDRDGVENLVIEFD